MAIYSCAICATVRRTRRRGGAGALHFCPPCGATLPALDKPALDALLYSLTGGYPRVPFIVVRPADDEPPYT